MKKELSTILNKFWTEFRNISPLLNFWKKYLLIETR